MPGFWHGDAFLYKQKDGTFKGSDIYAEYEMSAIPADYGTDIDFSVNGKIKHYKIKYDNVEYTTEVEIFENDNVIFSGKAIGAGDGRILLEDDFQSSEQIIYHTGNYVPTEEELYPGYTRLYNWSVSDKTDTRGEPYMLFLILMFGVILFLDIKFPMLFWILEHRLEVDGGEPSDWYLFGQKVSRVILSIAILVCMVVTFTIK